MQQAIDKLRELATEIGGVESGDGLFLLGLADAMEMGDRLDELDGKTLMVVSPLMLSHALFRDGELYEVHGARGAAVRAKKLYEPGSKHRWAVRPVLVTS